MEPLTEENEKLKEAMNLMERNIQRARRERDLAESNAWDLENQKGVQSEQLAVVSEQLKNASDQLEKKNQQLKSLTDQNTGMIIGEYTLYLFEQPSFS